MTNDKKTISTTFVGLILTFLALLIGTGAYAAFAGARAERKLDVHEAKQEECMKHLNDTLDRLEKNMDGQRKMIEDLWREKNGE